MEKKEINNRNETIINTVTIRDEKELHSQRWNEWKTLTNEIIFFLLN